jgi:pilus assembly protein FimV
MARNLGFLLALAIMLFSARSAALGLGEITLDSALNQLLVAEIELNDTSGLDSGEIIVSLGTRDDFERVGVERFFFLTDLRFEVVTGRNGFPVLQVSTTQPVTEPCLKIVVQVLWPNGRLLKEYTLLLDPPTFTEKSAPVVAAPARGDPGGSPAGRVQRQPTRPDSQVTFRERAASPTESPAAPQDRTSADSSDSYGSDSYGSDSYGSDSYGMTDRDDTLWSIASRVRPSRDFTVQQTMLAIQRLNPDAFIAGNINLLKAGYRLRLPNESEVGSLGQQQAVSQVAEHNAAWQSYRRGEGVRLADNTPSDTGGSSQLAAQIDATASSGAAPRAAASQDGELRIVAGATSNAGSGAGGDGQSVELENQLAASEEERDRVSLENEELDYRLDLMSTQMQQTQRQLEVRDQQIAQLQAQLAEIQAQLQAAAAAPTAVPPPAAATTAAQGTGASKPAFWQSPYVVVGGAVILVSLIVVGLIMARRRQGVVEDGAGLFAAEPLDEMADPMVGDADAEDEFEDEFEGEFKEESYDQDSAEDSLDDTVVEDDFDAEPEPEPEPEPEAEEELVADSDDPRSTGAQTGDVIGEADIYIAYGRYPQAVSLLLGALTDDPDRSEVRLKLLEVYCETKDQAAFDEHITELVERCDDDELLVVARELEASMRDQDGDDDEQVVDLEAASLDVGGVDDAYSSLGDSSSDDTLIAAIDDLDAAEVPAGSVLETDDDAAIDDGFSLSLDDDATDSDAAEEPFAEAAEETPAEVDGALSLSDLQSESGHGDDLGGDLGMDFDAEAPAFQETQVRDDAPADVALAEDKSEDESEDAFDADFNLDDLEFEATPGAMDGPAETDVAVESSVESRVATAADESEDAFDFLDDEDAATTKLDLARAYIDMGDEDGAREILTEVLSEGSDDQQQQAGELLEKIS